MKSLFIKACFVILFIVVFLSATHIKIAESCDQDCRYQRKKFTTEQMIKYKQHVNPGSVRSSTLVGIDALFM